jgi:uncharacterized BrkB/YihY/UPF0761 family membrane protein
MEHERTTLTGMELVRWLVMAALIIAGIALFFYFAPSTQPVVPPTVQESPR